MNVNVKAAVAADGTVTVDIEVGGRTASVEFTADKVEFSVPEEA